MRHQWHAADRQDEISGQSDARIAMKRLLFGGLAGQDMATEATRPQVTGLMMDCPVGRVCIQAPRISGNVPINQRKTRDFISSDTAIVCCCALPADQVQPQMRGRRGSDGSSTRTVAVAGPPTVPRRWPFTAWIVAPKLAQAGMHAPLACLG